MYAQKAWGHRVGSWLSPTGQMWGHLSGLSSLKSSVSLQTLELPMFPVASWHEGTCGSHSPSTSCWDMLLEMLQCWLQLSSALTWELDTPQLYPWPADFDEMWTPGRNHWKLNMQRWHPWPGCHDEPWIPAWSHWKLGAHWSHSWSACDDKPWIPVLSYWKWGPHWSHSWPACHDEPWFPVQSHWKLGAHWSHGWVTVKLTFPSQGSGWQEVGQTPPGAQGMGGISRDGVIISRSGMSKTKWSISTPPCSHGLLSFGSSHWFSSSDSLGDSRTNLESFTAVISALYLSDSTLERGTALAVGPSRGTPSGLDPMQPLASCGRKAQHVWWWTSARCLPVSSHHVFTVTDGAIDRGFPDQLVFGDNMGDHAPSIAHHRTGPTLVHQSSVAPGFGWCFLGHDSTEIEQKHAIV